MKTKRLLSVIILSCLLPLVASAYDVKINGIYYNLNQSSEGATASVTYLDRNTDSNKNAYTDIYDIPASITYDGVEYKVTSIGEYAFNGCKNLISVTIPNSVTSIGKYAFHYCISLTSVKIPNSATSIEEYTFYDCRSLTSVTIPNSVTSIKGQAFGHCNSLTSITIPNSVTSIGQFAFCYSGLTSITIPNSVTSLVMYAFAECYDLTSVTIGDGVTNISSATFSSCSSLTSVTIGNSVTSIGGLAFYGCSSLASITIPNNVTSIEDRAFANCSSLTSVTIPNSVTKIGPKVFDGCSSLTYIISMIDNPFEINENVFSDYSTPTLYVPKGTVEKYQATSAWNKFQNIEEFRLKGDVNDDGAIDVADIAAVIDVMAKGTNESVADVNDDKAVDVADIGTIIDIMAGKVVAEPDIPYEYAYTACPNDNHPHMIDLGLPSGTIWACCNVGASTPEGYGNYYTFEDAKAYNPPTLDQVNEFLNNTTSEWTVLNGVSGRVFTGRNRGTVFLPAAGYSRGGSDIYSVGTNGYFWSSTLDEEHSECAKDIVVNQNEAKIAFTGTTYMRLSVRPVR